eukprot:366557-Chlamydomonas_euryale.AAC.14
MGTADGVCAGGAAGRVCCRLTDLSSPIPTIPHACARAECGAASDGRLVLRAALGVCAQRCAALRTVRVRGVAGWRRAGALVWAAGDAAARGALRGWHGRSAGAHAADADEHRRRR